MSKYWAALADIDGERVIFQVGLSLSWQRFDKTLFGFSNQSYGYWVHNGAMYCELLVDSVSEVGTILGGGRVVPPVRLADVPHGRVRKSRAAYY